MFFLIAGLAFYLVGIFDLGFVNINKGDGVEAGKNLLAVVIITTSVVTGAFFIIKNYINSQISVKEKEMNKDFIKEIDRIVETFNTTQNAKFAEQNAKFAEQIAKIEQRFSEQTEEIRRLMGGKKEDPPKSTG